MERQSDGERKRWRARGILEFSGLRCADRGCACTGTFPLLATQHFLYCLPLLFFALPFIFTIAFSVTPTPYGPTAGSTVLHPPPQSGGLLSRLLQASAASTSCPAIPLPALLLCETCCLTSCLLRYGGVAERVLLGRWSFSMGTCGQLFPWLPVACTVDLKKVDAKLSHHPLQGYLF